MKGIELKINILEHEIMNLKHIRDIDNVKYELLKDLEKIKNSDDIDYMEKTLDTMFMRIDCLKQLPVTHHFERGNISVSVLNTNRNNNIDCFNENSLITGIIVDSFDDIKYISENKNKSINRIFNKILGVLKNTNYINKKDRLKDVFDCRIKLEKIKEYLNSQKEKEQNIKNSKNCLLNTYQSEINKEFDLIYKEYNNMNSYEKNMYKKASRGYSDAEFEKDEMLKLYKLDNVKNRLDELYSFVVDAKKHKDICDDEIDNITILMIKELKDLKPKLFGDNIKYYDNFVNELKKINETTSGIDKYIKLVELFKNIDSVKIIIFEKIINVNKDTLYDDIYKYYFNKVDEELSMMVIDNIENQNVLEQYMSFKDKIKKDDNESIDSLIEKIVILQSMKSKIKYKQKELIKK